MKHAACLVLAVMSATSAYADAGPSEGVDPNDRLLQLGLVDVTKPPYLADPTGTKDCTEAIQRAVNNARDNGFVCYFPEGTYVISDQISCEQQVRKLDRPRYTDGRTQHYWDLPHRIVMFGSGKGRRPLIKLSSDAEGFDDPNTPKVAIWIWAQTRHDAPNRDEPNWGEEQPNISFGHVFKGIDIDIRGHAGAIGLRHSGSQGSTTLDCTVYADNAVAGFSNCCGQGGGTYNVETVGGRYGITIEANSRFPMLAGCKFTGQTVASVGYHGGIQVPTLLVGCQLKPASGMAVDMTSQHSHAGINMVDCLVAVHPGGVIAGTRRSQNIHIEASYVRGAKSAASGGAELPASDRWTRIDYYSSSTELGLNLINGVQSKDEIARWEAIAEAPSFQSVRDKHCRRVPCFDEEGVVNVTNFGAIGDGQSDDTEAFRRAIAAGDRIFVPKGRFRLSGTLELRPNTHFFGLTRTYSQMVSDDGYGKREGRRSVGAVVRPDELFSLVTVDSPSAMPGFSHLGVRGNILWRSGNGTMMLVGALPSSISGNGGGRFYGVMSMGRQRALVGVQNPLSLYSFNVERVTQNPQFVIRDSKHLRIYYFKVEAGTSQRPNSGDANTPAAIINCEDVHVYCMYGNVKRLGQRPMLEVDNSRDIAVSQLKAFRPGTFPHLIETDGDEQHSIASSKTVTLFVRD